MFKFFKRRRPEYRAPEPTITIQDTLILRWYGYTPAEWCQLPAIVKVDKREGYAQAWGLGR